MGLIVAHPIANSEFGHFKKWLKGRAPRGERSEPRGTQRFCEGLYEAGGLFLLAERGVGSERRGVPVFWGLKVP